MVNKYIKLIFLVIFDHLSTCDKKTNTPDIDTVRPADPVEDYI